MHFDLHAHLDQRVAHGRADVLEGVDRRHREVAALHARAMALVAVGINRVAVPRTLPRVDLVRGAVHAAVPAHAVEDEEFVFRPEERAVGDARRLEVSLGAFAERTRTALVALHGGRLDDVAADVDRGLLEERIDHRGGRIEREDHVRLVDALPTRDGRAVEHLAVAEQVFIDQVRGNRYVLFFAARVGEAEIGVLDLLVLDQLDYICRFHCWRSSGRGLSLGLNAFAVPDTEAI